MQRVIQRAQRAARVVDRAKQRDKKALEKGQRQERRDRRLLQLRHENAAIRRARREREEDWTLGPLAPRRDVGDEAEHYGAESPYFVQPQPREPRDRPKWQTIYPGDRVVLLRGHDRGRIGEVTEYNTDAAVVAIKGLNVIDVAAPSFMLSAGDADGTSKIVPFTRPVPIEDVRLVYPLPHPETGVVRDVIIERLERIEVPSERPGKHADQKAKRGYRAIPGTNTIIPWPIEAEEVTPEEHEADTVRIDVDEVTNRMCLLYEPMPSRVLDELRNKYSRFRTRHNYNFVAKMDALEEKQERRVELIGGMRTPLQELAALRAQKKQAEERVLTDADLAEIGKVMAAQEATRTGLYKETSASAEP